MNTVRLKPQLVEKVRRVAARKGLSVSDVHREALETYCDAALAEQAVSRFDDVIGVVEAPHDLSIDTGRKFAEAMARKHGRHAG